jgi:hypothetical protein
LFLIVSTIGPTAELGNQTNVTTFNNVVVACAYRRCYLIVLVISY